MYCTLMTSQQWLLSDNVMCCDGHTFDRQDGEGHIVRMIKKKKKTLTDMHIFQYKI